MLKTKTDYKYIRDKMFGSNGQTRVAIDADVLGTRAQKRINRNVDYFYLKEIDTLYNTSDLQQSVEFAYPISTSNKLLAPKTDGYADKAKLDKLNVDSEDIFKYSGNEDPDYDALRKRLDMATDAYRKAIESALTTKTETINALKAQYQKDIQAYASQTAALDAQLQGIDTEYQRKLSSNDEDYKQKLSSLNERASEIDKQYRSNKIDLKTWNTQRSQLEDEYYEAYKDYFAGAEDAEAWRSTQKATVLSQKFEVHVNELETTKKYNEDVAKADEQYATTLSQEQKKLNQTSQEIWNQSNGRIVAFIML